MESIEEKTMKIQWGKVITSKTMWLNLIALAIAIVQAVEGQAWIDPKIQVGILAVLNAIVRFLTNDAIIKK